MSEDDTPPTETTDGTAAPAASSSRVAQFRQAVSDLKVRARGKGIEYWLFVAGSVLVPFGLLLTVLGWYGASHTPFVFEQIPYMISGGLLGLGLVFGGGFAYFAYWVARLAAQQRQQAVELIEALGRLEVAMASGAAAATGPAVAGPATDNGSTKGERRLVATPTGTMFHRPDCVVVAKREALAPVGVDDPGFSPCKLCDPLGPD